MESTFRTANRYRHISFCHFFLHFIQIDAKEKGKLEINGGNVLHQSNRFTLQNIILEFGIPKVLSIERETNRELVDNIDTFFLSLSFHIPK